MAWNVPWRLDQVITSPLYSSSSKYEVISSISVCLSSSSLQGHSDTDSTLLQSCSVAWDRSVLQIINIHRAVTYQYHLQAPYWAYIGTTLSSDLLGLYINPGDVLEKWFVLVWPLTFIIFIYSLHNVLPSIQLIVGVEPMFGPRLSSVPQSSQQRLLDLVDWILINDRIKFSCKKYLMIGGHSLEKIVHLRCPNNVGRTATPVYPSRNKKIFWKYYETLRESA